MNGNGKKIVTLEDVKHNHDIRELIKGANEYLEVKGYTEHGLRHVGYVSATTANILSELEYDERMVELGAIAGWIHDIGNSINRQTHGISGAIMAQPILAKMGMPMHEIVPICMAIGNHEEENGLPVNPISAALILADKSDAHRTRVRKELYDPEDIHDRVNYSIKKNFLVIDKKAKIIRLVIFMDTHESSHMDFFQIYLTRMVLSEKASAFLGYSFELVINDVVLNNHRPIKKSPSIKLSANETAVSAEETDTE